MNYNPVTRYNPNESDGIKSTQNAAAKTSEDLATAHYPYAVMQSRDELRHLAEDQFGIWWKRLENSVNYQKFYSGVKRIYVAAFSGAYTSKVEDCKRYEQEEKERKARYEAERREAERREAERHREEAERQERERREQVAREAQRRREQDELIEQARRQSEAKAAEDARRQAEIGQGVRVEITNGHEYAGFAMYTVEFFDPIRMAHPVSFGVSVFNDGLVELKELKLAVEPDG